MKRFIQLVAITIAAAAALTLIVLGTWGALIAFLERL